MHPVAPDKFVVFKLAERFLALPISTVLKVINFPSATNENFKALEIVQIGHHAIALWDLHQRLASGDRSVANEIRPFLLVAQVLPGELCAIPLEEPPDLVELPRNSWQNLPRSFAQEELRHLVKHVAIVSEGEKTFTLFLLDLSRALSPRLIATER